MLIIGLTGSIGSGKSTVASFFKARGAYVIDADRITRDLLAPEGKCIKKVAKIFGRDILTGNCINRSYLAKIVFSHPRELKKLTDILYPEAFKEVKKQISLNKNARLIVLDVPLLFESGWHRITATNIVVYATHKQLCERAQKNLKISKAEVNRRLKFQMSMTKKKALADIIIDNSQSQDKTRQQVDAIIDRLLKRKN